MTRAPWGEESRLVRSFYPLVWRRGGHRAALRLLARLGGWRQARTSRRSAGGGSIPFEPNPADLDIGDIANALAHQCRFGGHSRAYYSVAQHSCLIADLVLARGGSEEDALWALLHDASEAYLVDLPHPIKHRSELGRLYAEAEAPLQDAILERFGLPREAPALVKPLRSRAPRNGAARGRRGGLALARAGRVRSARPRD